MPLAASAATVAALLRKQPATSSCAAAAREIAAALSRSFSPTEHPAAARPSGAAASAAARAVAAVSVRGGSAWGSAVVLDGPSGLLLTNAHLVHPGAISSRAGGSAARSAASAVDSGEAAGARHDAWASCSVSPAAPQEQDGMEPPRQHSGCGASISASPTHASPAGFAPGGVSSGFGGGGGACGGGGGGGGGSNPFLRLPPIPAAAAPDALVRLEYPVRWNKHCTTHSRASAPVIYPLHRLTELTTTAAACSTAALRGRGVAARGHALGVPRSPRPRPAAAGASSAGSRLRGLR